MSDYRADASIAEWLGRNRTEADAELIWIDLETTGLDPLDGRIIEVGALATDVWGAVVPDGVFHCLVYSQEVHDGELSDFIFNMHSQSGLLEEHQHFAQVAPGPDNPLQFTGQAEQSLANWIKSMTKGDKLPLAGSSVHFDRAWLEAHMPKVVRALHYRNVDSSGFKIVENLLDKRREAGGIDLPSIFRPNGDGGHRSLPDLVESIKLYRYFLHEYFIAPGKLVPMEKGYDLL